MHTAREQCQQHADADGSRAVNSHHLAAFDLAAAHGVVSHGHRLDQRAVRERQARGQLVRHAPFDHRVFSQPAAGAVVAVERDQLAVVVAAAGAGQAMAAGFERLHGDAVADGKVLDTRRRLRRFRRRAHGRE